MGWLVSLLPVVKMVLGLISAAKDQPGARQVSARKARKRAKELVLLSEDAVLSEMSINTKEQTGVRRQLVQVMIGDGYPEIMAQMAVHSAANEAWKKYQKGRKR